MLSSWYEKENLKNLQKLLEIQFIVIVPVVSHKCYDPIPHFLRSLRFSSDQWATGHFGTAVIEGCLIPKTKELHSMLQMPLLPLRNWGDLHTF